MADLTLKPDWAFPTRTKYDTIKSEFENGQDQRRARRSQPIREWSLGYRNRSASDASTIQTLFDSVKGSYDSFTWTNPLDDADYTVRFKEDTFEKVNTGYGLFDFQFELEEVLE